MKMKPLKPTLRQNRRYLVFQIIGDGTISSESQMELGTRLVSLLGVFGAAKAAIRIMKDKYNSKTHTGIIMATASALDHVKVCLGLVTSLAGTPVIIRTIGVSGILAKTARF